MSLIDASFVTNRLPGLSGSRLASLPGIVAAANARILSHLRRPIVAADYDEVYRVGPRDSVRLHYPVISLDAVFLDKSNVNILTDVDSYRLDPGLGVLWLPRGIEARVVYRAGYETIPSDIREAAFLLVQAFLENIPDGSASDAVASSGSLSGIRLGDYAENYTEGNRAALGFASGASIRSGLPPVVRAMLGPYVDHVGVSRRW